MMTRNHNRTERAEWIRPLAAVYPFPECAPRIAESRLSSLELRAGKGRPGRGVLT
jgi:hypothetical protein